MIFSIYKIAKISNPKRCYIGFTKNWEDRKRGHIKTSRNPKKSHNPVFYTELNKHGYQQFSWEVIYQSKDKDHCLSIMETFFIKEYNSHVSKGGYNLSWGGDGSPGYIPSEQMKQKLSVYNKSSEHNKIQLAEARKNYMTKYPHGPNYGNHTEPKAASAVVKGSKWAYNPITKECLRVSINNIPEGYVLGRPFKKRKVS